MAADMMEASGSVLYLILGGEEAIEAVTAVQMAVRHLCSEEVEAEFVEGLSVVPEVVRVGPVP